MQMLNAHQIVPPTTEGIIDRISNGREILKFLRSGIVSEVLDIIELVPNGMYGPAVVDAGDILVIEGFITEGEAVRNLGVAMTPRPFNWETIIPPACKVEEILLLNAVRKWGTMRGPEMSARVDVFTATRLQMQGWVRDNKAPLREAFDRPGIRRIIERQCPEVLRAVNGDPETMSLTPEQAEKRINAIGWAITALSIVSVYPPAAPFCALAITILKAYQTWLKGQFPEIKALPEFIPDSVERGLDLSDLTVLA